MANEVNEFDRQFSDVVEVAEDDTTEEDEETDGFPDEGSQDAFVWLRLVKSVSGLTLCSFSECWRMNITEFFTYLMFARKLALEERDRLQKMRHGKFN